MVWNGNEHNLTQLSVYRIKEFILSRLIYKHELS